MPNPPLPSANALRLPETANTSAELAEMLNRRYPPPAIRLRETEYVLPRIVVSEPVTLLGCGSTRTRLVIAYGVVAGGASLCLDRLHLLQVPRELAMPRALIHVLRGSATLTDCRLSAWEGPGVRCDGTQGRIDLRRCQVLGRVGSAVMLTAGALGSITDCVMRGGACCVSLESAAAGTIEGTTFDASGVGVRVVEQAALKATKLTFGGFLAVGLEVTDAGRTYVSACEWRPSSGMGVVVSSGGRLSMDSCRLGPCDQGAILVDDAELVANEVCIDAPKCWGMWVCHSGSAIVSTTQVRGGAPAAVLVSHGAAAAFDECVVVDGNRTSWLAWYGSRVVLRNCLSSGSPWAVGVSLGAEIEIDGLLFVQPPCPPGESENSVLALPAPCAREHRPSPSLVGAT